MLTATIIPGETLTILGDRAGNTIEIAEVDGTVFVTADGERTAVETPHRLRVATYGGEDTVIVSLQSALHALRIDTGPQDDFVDISATLHVGGSLWVDGGNDNDELTTTIQVAPDPLRTRAATRTTLNVLGGPGNDIMSGLVEVAWNPQPEPPAIETIYTLLNMRGDAGDDDVRGLAKVGFNPQPEPPARIYDEVGFLPNIRTFLNVDGGIGNDNINGLAEVAWNPQPRPLATEHLPSIDTIVRVTGGYGDDIMSGLAKVGFNPQPEPPAFDGLLVGLGTIPNTRTQVLMDGGIGNDDVRGLAEVGFNPQPEPPGAAGARVETTVLANGGRGNDIMSGLAKVGFNPQPEPPADVLVLGYLPDVITRVDVNGGIGNDYLISFAEVGFNPQPEPPGADSATVETTVNATGGRGDDIMSGLAKVGFNPQPEPPAAGAATEIGTVTTHAVGFLPNVETNVRVDGGFGNDDLSGLAEVGFNPQPEPPGAEGAIVETNVTATGGYGDDIMSGLAKVGFNPQPEPPAGELKSHVARETIVIGFLPNVQTEVVVDGGVGNDDMTGLAEVGFNPQPEPPGAEAALVTTIVRAAGGRGNDIMSGLAKVGFNPQPEPPASGLTRGVDEGYLPNVVTVVDVDGSTGNDQVNGLAEVGFNPQPEPPGAEGTTVETTVNATGGHGNDIMSGLAKVGFNPQPEPPALGKVADGIGDDLGHLGFLPHVDTEVRVDGGFGNDDITGLAEVGFNPQPEPPGADGAIVTTNVRATGGHGNDIMSGLAKVGFNPQPEPPAAELRYTHGEPPVLGYSPRMGTAVMVDGGVGNDDISGLAEVGFNPQPEPPGTDLPLVATDVRVIGGRGDDLLSGLAKVGFNPQPEPPALSADKTASREGFSPNAVTRINVLGETGNDTIESTYNLSELVGNVYIDINGGLGNDIVHVRGHGEVTSDIVFRIYGDRGNDELHGYFDVELLSEGYLRAEVRGHSGNDDVGLVVNSEETRDGLFAILDGGSGFDTGFATDNVYVRRVERFEPVS